jgi:hypothetical protein
MKTSDFSVESCIHAGRWRRRRRRRRSMRWEGLHGSREIAEGVQSAAAPENDVEAVITFAGFN